MSVIKKVTYVNVVKRHLREFHVVFVYGRQRNVQKCLMHVHYCLAY